MKPINPDITNASIPTPSIDRPPLGDAVVGYNQGYLSESGGVVVVRLGLGFVLEVVCEVTLVGVVVSTLVSAIVSTIVSVSVIVVLVELELLSVVLSVLLTGAEELNARQSNRTHKTDESVNIFACFVKRIY